MVEKGKFYYETPCEHGYAVEHVQDGFDSRQPPHDPPNHVCPGGSRTEVTPPGDLDEPRLVWVDVDASVWKIQEDGWYSIDGDGCDAIAALVEGGNQS